MNEIAKTYEPKEVEARIYQQWQDAGYFKASPDPDKKPFCIVIPPPNVTGVLHIGHALDDTLQDVLIRFKRMQGFAALWIPGTDHAGIATQNVVERELRAQGLTRHDLGREKFVERVWEWKEKYGGLIINQLKRLGASCDWSRERFTMDPGLSRAVRKVFVDLFNEKLIYRGNRIINWCPRCETALSDIEVNHVEHAGELVSFSYELEDGSARITVATTRLETMLGDTAIAVHPDDDRYKNLVGRMVRHPFDGRTFPIVGDPAVDPSFGTGAVKVTPAHDQTDFEIASRHNLEKINIFTKSAEINEDGGKFAGMERYAAREAVRKALADGGWLEGTQAHLHPIGHCSRCDTIVEPWLSEQWFVSMEPLAEPAIAAVKEGRTQFYPARWGNFYLDWMENIRDWCISRQLWWGHRIPVWYCECGHQWAAIEDPIECPQCRSAKLFQDPDVLDTWFSSQLWPFSTLGWPEASEDLEYFYPTSVLVTGYEIIHLWVARMMMAGVHFAVAPPFAWVFVHGIVRDAHGQKMSKSLGNVIDPLDLIENYGTDALRFTLAEHATGQDIFLDEQWVEGSRNFANKLWNASRFVLSQAKGSFGPLPPEPRWTTADRWILSRCARTVQEVTQRLEGFEVAMAARAAFNFVRNEFCDWYIEAAKLRLYGDDPEASADASAVLSWVLQTNLRLLHPIMPFVTEHIWSLVPGDKPSPAVMVSQWPPVEERHVDRAAEERFQTVMEIVSAVRSFRASSDIAPGKRIKASLTYKDAGIQKAVAAEMPTVASLARMDEQPVIENTEAAVVRLQAGPVEILVSMEGLVDVEAEREKLGKAIAKLRREIGAAGAKLSNETFMAKAPPEVVAEQRRRLEDATAQQAKLVAQLEQLG